MIFIVYGLFMVTLGLPVTVVLLIYVCRHWEEIKRQAGLTKQDTVETVDNNAHSHNDNRLVLFY